jgi:peptide/nickel transport system substrate-binding protein
MTQRMDVWQRSVVIGGLLAVIAACSSDLAGADDGERRRTVYFETNQMGDITANPFTHLDAMVNGFHQAMIEPLFLLNYESGEIEPWLGLSMTANAAQDLWTLTLRPGVTWSDGEPFTADDVVFTVAMLLDYAPDLAQSANLKRWVRQAEKVDDLTVEFTLTAPNPRFQLDFWSVKIRESVYIVPAHIWRGQDPLTFTNLDPERGWPVFTGPYRLERMIPHTRIEFVRDDDWWGARRGWKPLPRPTRLVWMFASAEGGIADLAANRLDALHGGTAPEALFEHRQRNPNILTWTDDLPYAWLDPCPRTLDVNHRVPPWDDRVMRWALNYAIQRDELIAYVYQRTTTAARHFFPAYAPLNRYVNVLEHAGLYDDFPLLAHHPEAARRLIESRGWAVNPAHGYYERDGEVLTLDITPPDYAEYVRLADAIAAQLRRVGIRAASQPLDGPLWNARALAGDYEGLISWFSCGSVNEPWDSMDNFNTRWLRPAGQATQQFENVWRWSGESADRYSALVDAIGQLPLGAPAIEPLFLDAMRLWLAELPAIPLVQAGTLLPFDTTYWRGWPTSDNNYIHPPTWWQSTHIILHHLEPAPWRPEVGAPEVGANKGQ